MWLPLQVLLDKIPEPNWNLLRKLRLKVRAKTAFAYSTPLLLRKYVKRDGEWMCNLRLGKIYPSDSVFVNVVPIKKPSNWMTFFKKEVEVFVDIELYNDKLFPIIFSKPQ